MKTKENNNKHVVFGTVKVSVWCDKFLGNEVGLRFIWINVPAYEVPKVGDVLCLQDWDLGDGIDDSYYKVQLREFVYVGTNNFDSIRLIVEPA